VKKIPKLDTLSHDNKKELEIARVVVRGLCKGSRKKDMEKSEEFNYDSVPMGLRSVKKKILDLEVMCDNTRREPNEYMQMTHFADVFQNTDSPLQLDQDLEKTCKICGETIDAKTRRKETLLAELCNDCLELQEELVTQLLLGTFSP
jgi:hypothetical protein